MSKQTTKAHFAIFEAEAQYWIGHFGLNDWEVWFEHGIDEEHSPTVVATCWINLHARTTIFALCKPWGAAKPLTEEEIRCAAFHEVCHMLLSPIVDSRIREDSKLAKEVYESQEHAIIQCLTNTVWGNNNK